MAIVDFIVSLLERFYRNRLECFANDRVTDYKLSLEKMMALCSYISKENVRKDISDGGSLLRSESGRLSSTV